MPRLRKMPTQAPIVGVMGGSFNPIHLGHVLLAVTVRETKPVDEVVMVPVFKHPVKTDLLPFECRVAMCELAVRGKGIKVSTIERETGESNVVMLQALRRKYPVGAQVFWVCGDDVFEWIENAKGQAMMKELDGLIVQRRLHRGDSSDTFHKSPMDTGRLAALGTQHGLKIDVIFGELPHFSSTLVRSSPAGWRAYLPSSVAAYLEKRPEMLARAVSAASGAADLEPACKKAKLQVSQQEEAAREAITSSAMRCIELVHGLQRERGCTALALAAGSDKAMGKLQQARADVDELVRELPEVPAGLGDALSLAEELKYTPEWLSRDRRQYDWHIANDGCRTNGGGDLAAAWLRRVALLKKWNARIDVLLEACAQLLQTRVEPSAERGGIESEPEFLFRLFCLWAQAKEALGRERLFLCAGGKDACGAVRRCLRMRSALHDVIEYKEIMLRRIFSVEQEGGGSRFQSVEALQGMLTRITAIEWSLMGCFAASTPQTVQHKIVSGQCASLLSGPFDVEAWYDTTSSAIDLMLTLVQGLAASMFQTHDP